MSNVGTGTLISIICYIVLIGKIFDIIYYIIISNISLTCYEKINRSLILVKSSVRSVCFVNIETSQN